MKNLVALASVASGVTIVVAILAVGYLFNDINGFYDDALVEMDEFKVCVVLRRIFAFNLQDAPNISFAAHCKRRLEPYDFSHQERIHA